MDFALNEDQLSIKALAEQIFSDASNDESLRALSAKAEYFDRDLWATLAQAGLLGLTIDEAFGGSAMGIIEAGLLLEEQGRSLAPVPLLPTLIYGAMTLNKFGSDAQKNQWLPAIINGEAIITAALEEAGNPYVDQPLTTAQKTADGWQLTGVKTAVPYGMQAAAILVPAQTDAGVAVFLMTPETGSNSLKPQQSTSGEPQAELQLSADNGHHVELIGSVANGADILSFIVNHGRVGLAATQLGLTSEALRRTALYSSERIQFGRALGSMQGVQQRAADSFIAVEAIRSAYLRAAWLLSEDKPNDAEIATAKYWAAIGGHIVTHTAQHLHGGIGADIDYPIHRFFLNAKQIELALGGTTSMLAAIGRQIADGKTSPLA